MTAVVSDSRQSTVPVLRSRESPQGPLAPGRTTELDAASAKRATLLEGLPRWVPVAGVHRPIAVKMASERREWEDAFHLVAQNYRSRGYEPADAKGLRFTSFHALPDTVTFVASCERQIVATLSLVMDNVLLGLPMETIYGAELLALRRQGRRVVEVTNLADRELGIREFVPVFVSLMRLMAQYAVHEGADALVISVNPRHSNFYRKVLGFVPLGECRAYPIVQNHPAEGFLLDVPLLRCNSPQMYEQIFGEALPAPALAAPRMPVPLVRYFAGRSSQTNGREVNAILTFVENYGSPRRWL